MKCTDCKGSKQYVGLELVEQCKHCGGTGEEPTGEGEAEDLSEAARADKYERRCKHTDCPCRGGLRFTTSGRVGTDKPNPNKNGEDLSEAARASKYDRCRKHDLSDMAAWLHKTDHKLSVKLPLSGRHPCRGEDRLPWEIYKATRLPQSKGLRLVGFNHYEGKRFVWHIDWYSFRDPDFASRRYDFSGTEFEEGARELLDRWWPTRQADLALTKLAVPCDGPSPDKLPRPSGEPCGRCDGSGEEPPADEKKPT